MRQVALFEAADPMSSMFQAFFAIDENGFKCGDISTA
jgi:hypothetical protein